MKRYGNIYEKICDKDNLRLAHQKARKDKAFYKDVQMVDNDLEYYINEIHLMLKNQTYEVSEYTISYIQDKGKERELAKLPYFPDRIIQWAILLQIEPIFMSVFTSDTCASLKKRGIHYALEKLDEYLTSDIDGTLYCLKGDVKKFYPSIDTEILKNMLRKKFKDEKLLNLLDKIIDSNTQSTGIPIGSYLSQFLGNFYLAYFDHWIKEECGCKYYIRYMDDIVILHSSKEFLQNLTHKIDNYLNDELNLVLKGNYQVFSVDVRGIDFVGYRHFRGYIILRKSTYRNIIRLIRDICYKIHDQQFVTYSQYCSFNSYKGWIRYMTSDNFYNKYFKPLENYI